MSTDRPPGPDDPFAKRPGGSGASGGSPYDRTPGEPPPGGGGGEYGGGSGPPDPLAGMAPLADPGKRLLARLVDIVIVLIPLSVISWLTGGLEMNSYEFDYVAQFSQSLIAAVLFVGYDTWMTVKSGRTVGKKLMGLRVAVLTNGGNPDLAVSLTRAVVLWLPAVFCCACIWTAISGGWSLFDKPYHQGLHDKAAKTVVVQE